MSLDPRSVVGPRGGTMRPRRGRGPRGPRALAGPLSPSGIPADLTRSQQFDQLVSAVVDSLRPAFEAASCSVEVVIDDAPSLPDSWDQPVPTSVVTRSPDAARLVLFRLPMGERATSSVQLEDLTWSVLLTQLADIWQVDPDDLDPRL